MYIPFIDELCEMANNMYRLGWDERNSGNISCIIDDSDVFKYLKLKNDRRFFPITFDVPRLAGKYFLVTGTGVYFKNIAKNPQASLGIIKISPDGKSYELLWGFENGESPTSELASHFLAHQTRLDCEEKHRVIMHAHPTNLVAMTFVHSLDEREFTRTLWRMCTECMMIFPEGIAVLPWMLCGTAEIGAATAEKMKDQRLVVWANHGIFGAGKSLDDAFGLLETVEKAAEIYMKIGFKKVLQSITDTQLNSIANAYNVKPKKGYLDLDL